MDETNYDLEQAHYHFVLGEVAHYVTQYGIDTVMVDIYDTLARECNAKVTEYHTHED